MHFRYSGHRRTSVESGRRRTSATKGSEHLLDLTATVRWGPIQLRISIPVRQILAAESTGLPLRWRHRGDAPLCVRWAR